MQDCTFLHTCLVSDRPTRQDPIGSIDTLWGIWQHTYTVTTTEVSPDFEEFTEILDVM